MRVVSNEVNPCPHRHLKEEGIDIKISFAYIYNYTYVLPVSYSPSRGFLNMTEI